MRSFDALKLALVFVGVSTHTRPPSSTLAETNMRIVAASSTATAQDVELSTANYALRDTSDETGCLTGWSELSDKMLEPKSLGARATVALCGQCSKNYCPGTTSLPGMQSIIVSAYSYTCHDERQLGSNAQCVLCRTTCTPAATPWTGSTRRLEPRLRSLGRRSRLCSRPKSRSTAATTPRRPCLPSSSSPR